MNMKLTAVDVHGLPNGEEGFNQFTDLLKSCFNEYLQNPILTAFGYTLAAQLVQARNRLPLDRMKEIIPQVFDAELAKYGCEPEPDNAYFNDIKTVFYVFAIKYLTENTPDYPTDIYRNPSEDDFNKPMLPYSTASHRLGWLFSYFFGTNPDMFSLTEEVSMNGLYVKLFHTEDELAKLNKHLNANFHRG